MGFKDGPSGSASRPLDGADEECSSQEGEQKSHRHLQRHL
jgi:hypothetical protein